MFKDELHLLGANHVWMMTRRVYRGQWRPGRTPTVDELRHMPIDPSMCLTLVSTAFNLIFLIPDKVIEWIGGTQLASGQGDEAEHKQVGQRIGAFVHDTNRQMGGGKSGAGTSGSGATPNSIQRR